MTQGVRELANERNPIQSEEEMIEILMGWTAAINNSRVNGGLAGASRWFGEMEKIADKALQIPQLPAQSHASIAKAQKKIRPAFERLVKVAAFLSEHEQWQFGQDLLALGQYSGEIMQLGTWPEGHDSIAAIRKGRALNLDGQKKDADRKTKIRMVIESVDSLYEKASLKKRNTEANLLLKAQALNPLSDKTFRSYRKY